MGLNENTYKSHRTIYEILHVNALNLYEFLSSPAGFMIDSFAIMANYLILTQPPPTYQVVVVGFSCFKALCDGLNEAEKRSKQGFEDACKDLPLKDQNNPVNKKR